MSITLQRLQQPLAKGHVILTPGWTSQGKRRCGAGGKRSRVLLEERHLSTVCAMVLSSWTGLERYLLLTATFSRVLGAGRHGMSLSLELRAFRFHNTGDPWTYKRCLTANPLSTGQTNCLQDLPSCCHSQEGQVLKSVSHGPTNVGTSPRALLQAILGRRKIPECRLDAKSSPRIMYTPTCQPSLAVNSEKKTHVTENLRGNLKAIFVMSVRSLKTHAG